MVVNSEQNKLPWSTPGLAYGVDSVGRSTGIKYADSFYVDMHTRLEAFEKNVQVATCIRDVTVYI